ncbi:hypothetical protein P8C59_003644 [Phyllachora maydis]|uniref:Pentatricopeptide repeat-containing protein n=1 Tax=Phyllachora maydis TaxID=1825666 RepID=A0AAD9I0T0_9PEZI|nr:hypothetical protein P8C59_003644 [Phyllachora maydis]
MICYKLHSERQKETWEALCNMMVFLFENRRLASEARFKAKALDILRSLLNKRLLDYNSPHALALSTAIVSFKKGVDTKDLQVSPAKLFEELLAMGLRPNVIHYTCIMRNLCLHKEVDAAWKVFEIMLEHNIEPDATTYSVLISGAKLIGDVQTVGSVLNAAMSRNAYNRAYCHFFRLDPLQRLALSDLASLLEFRQDQSSSLRWASVHQVTAVIQSLPSFPPEELLEPDGATLGIMLIGYIKALPTAYTLVAFYSQFRAQLKLGDPATIAIVRETGTLVYDTIIKALTEWDGMLRVALDIMGEMLKDAASVASATSAAPATCTAAGSPAPGLSASDARASEHVETDVSATQASPSGSSPSNSSQPVSGPADCPSAASSDSPASDPAAVSAPAGDACDLSMLTRHPVPSVYTWSILLHGFMHRGQTEQGERILQTMREHGVTPTVVTWNTLLAGYTRLQKLQLAVRTLARMERAGLRHDDFTIRGFGYLANKKRAVDMVHNRLRQRKEQLEKQIEREWRREVGGASAEKLQQLQEQMDHVRSTMGEDQIDPRSGAWDVQRHVDEQRQAARSV